MYLRTLHLQSIKHIRDLTLSFERGEGDDTSARMWTVLLGENGTGKTTILRSIALAAGGEIRANQLLGSNIVELLPVQQQRSTSAFSGIFTQSTTNGEAKTRSYRLNENSLNIEAVLVPRARPPSEEVTTDHSKELPFIAYAVNRNLSDPKTSARPKLAALERLQPLFGKVDLIGTNFYDHLRDEAEELAAAYLATLGEVFERLLPRFKKLERGQSNEHFTLESGPRGLKIPATWLSQGEQATVSWIADMIGWIFWNRKSPIQCKDMRAVVLIDELDLHLHPRWQRTLVSDLKALFPNIQFIVTTHSPLILSGVEADEIIRLDLNEEGEVDQVEQDDDPRFMTSAQLFHSFFGVSKARQDGLDEKVMRYGMLVGDPGRSPREDTEMKRLEGELIEAGLDPDWEPVPIDPDLQRED
jgi:hypothetical protein